MSLTFARFKRCTKCTCTKPATPEFFHKASSGHSLGLQSNCKVCRNLDNKTYHTKTTDKAKAYRLANREVLLEKSRQRYVQNREYRLAQAAQYRENNAEKARECVRNWNRRNADKKLIHSRNYKASKRNAAGSHTIADIRGLFNSQNGLCAYCEVPLDTDSYHVDHMNPLSRGGSNGWENLAITCSLCNLQKGTRTAEEFMVYLHQKEGDVHDLSQSATSTRRR